jgi:hypothetical protein
MTRASGLSHYIVSRRHVSASSKRNPIAPKREREAAFANSWRRK